MHHYLDIALAVIFGVLTVISTLLQYMVYRKLKKATVQRQRDVGYWPRQAIGAFVAILIVVIALSFGLRYTAYTYAISLIPYYFFLLLISTQLAPPGRPSLKA